MTRQYDKVVKTSQPQAGGKAGGRKPPAPAAPVRSSGRAGAAHSGRGKAPGKPLGGTLLSRLRGVFQRQPAAKAGHAKAAAGHEPTGYSGLSLDQRLDVVGYVLLFGGLALVLSLFSIERSAASGNLLSLLSQAFGLGIYAFPLTLMFVGGWLVMRSFERVPRVAAERVFGLFLLFGGLLGWLHLLAFPVSLAASFALAERGLGGGYLGAGLFELLRGNLGWGGAAIALFSWSLIAVTLLLDTSVLELFRWLPPLALRVQDAWDDWQVERAERAAAERAGYNLYREASRPVSAPGALPGVLPGMQPGHPAAAGTPAAAAAGGPAIPQAVWELPRLADILEKGVELEFNDEIDRQRATLIEQTLASFGAPVNVVEINRGPTITQFGVEPDFVESRGNKMRVRVGKIALLSNDLALALSARAIRIQAPVPGKGFVGIEVPNEETASVMLRDVIESEAFRRLKSPLRFALGQDVAGNAVAADLAAMPHLLIAGATGSGKSVCVNALICCLLLHNTPDELRLIMVDPKRVELTGYNGIPHLLAPVVVDTERVVGALQWVLREMDMRYQKLAEVGTRNIQEYNARMVAKGAQGLPRLVVIIDELADLMMLSPDETERSITRLAQLARATGIHLILATQRPSVDVVTGLIKANFPARVAFAVASGVDSRVILDQPGAERLLGRGDMLFQAPDAPAALRLQGAYLSDVEIQRLVQYWTQFTGLISTAPVASGGDIDALPSLVPLKQIPLWEEAGGKEAGDPLLSEAIDLCRKQGRASISMLQRRFRIGYTRAARIVESMQDKKIIGVELGPQGFAVLDYGQAAPPVDLEN